MSKKENFMRILLCAIFLTVSVMDIFAYNSNTKTEDIISAMTSASDKVKENVADAIISVETHGNPRKVNGTCCGPMQIKPCLVKACNTILKNHGIKNYRFTLQDRFNIEKSKQMFKLFNYEYNKGFNIEKAIRSWNGGPGYKVKSTQKYYNKVIACYNKLKNKK